MAIRTHARFYDLDLDFDFENVFKVRPYLFLLPVAYNTGMPALTLKTFEALAHLFFLLSVA